MSESINNEETIGSTIFKIEDGILLVSYKPNAVSDLNESKLFLARQHELLGDAKVPLFSDGTNLQSMSREVRNLFASVEGSHNVKALAVLVPNSTTARVIATLFMGLNKPLIPTRTFASKKEALEWLQQYR